MFRILWHNRELLWTLIKRDLKVRYKASVLGFFWSFCKPLLLTLVLLAVFSQIPRFNMEAKDIPFVMHLLVGVLAWTFFSGSLNDGMFAIISNENLVKKVKLPVEVLPAASVASNLVHFILAQFVLLVFVLIFGIPLTGWLLLAPFVIALLTYLALSLAMLVSALNVFYRDVVSVTEIALQAWFYGTPIFYAFYHATTFALDRMPRWVYWVYVSNPLTPIVVAYRRVVLAGGLHPREIPDAQLLPLVGLSFGICVLIHLGCYAVFKHYKPRFADEL